MNKTFAMMALCLAAVVPAASGQLLNEDLKLTANDGAAGDRFGYSISVSGDTAVVGAIADDDGGDQTGSAYIYRLDGTGWMQEAKLLPADAAAVDQFGSSVSVSGDVAVIGARFDDDNGSDSGSAYVFRFDGTSWVQEAKLLAADGANGDRFGFSVSISGSAAVIGAYRNDDNGGNSGSAYVFRFDGMSWVQEAKLLPADGDANDLFGYSASVSGDTAVIGTPFDDDNGDNSGSAYVFRFDGTSWAQEAKLLPASGATGDDNFGASVSVSGSAAVIGTPFDDDNGAESGSAHVFRFDGTSWAQETKLLPAGGAAVDRIFGWSVSVSDGTAVIGAYLDNANGAASGSAYIFDLGSSSCPGDIADDFGSIGPDGMVGFGDFLALLGLVGPCPGGPPPPLGCDGDIADDFGTLGSDGMVSFGDFLALLGLVGPCP